MKPEIKAALLRFGASLLNMYAAQLRLTAATVEATAKLDEMVESMQSGVDEEIRSNPELMELDAMLDGFYGQENDNGKEGH